MTPKQLREDWINFRLRCEQTAPQKTAEGAYARAMLKLMPALVDYLTEEVKAGTHPRFIHEAIAAAAANFALHSIGMTANNRAIAYADFLARIDSMVKPRLDRTTKGILIPNGESVQ